MWFQARRYLTLAQVDFYCVSLAEQAQSFCPEVVVSIERGGWYVGHRLSGLFGVPHAKVVVGREIHCESLYKPFPRALVFIPAVIHGVLFLTKTPVLLEGLGREGEGLVRGRRVLLVDDAAQSGNSLAAAAAHVRMFAPAALKSAVLCDVLGSRAADYACFSGVHYYPWSRSSPEHTVYARMRAA